MTLIQTETAGVAARRPGPARRLMTCVLTRQYHHYHFHMTARRITANLPSDLHDQAMQATGRGITETLIAGLERLRRADAYRKAMTLKGKIPLAVDLETSRERRRR